MPPLSRELVERMLMGDARAAREFVDAATPVIQGRITRVLLRWRSKAYGRDLRQEVEDLTQSVFEALLAERGHALLEWNPERGSSFEGFLALLTEHRAYSILRCDKTSPWTEDPTENEDFDDGLAPPPGLERQVSSAEQLRLLWDRLAERLTTRGLLLFRWLVIEERSVEEVCELAGMTPDAIYAWRLRVKRLVHALAAELDPPSGRGGSSPAATTQPEGS